MSGPDPTLNGGTSTVNTRERTQRDDSAPRGRNGRLRLLARRLPAGAAAATIQLGPALAAFGGWKRYAAHPARRRLVPLAAGGAALAVVNGVSTDAGPREVSRQRLAMPLITGGIIVGRALAPISDRRDWLALPDSRLRNAGLALYALGIALFEWPRFVMGGQFSFKAAIQDDHELVTRGPYRVLRHPGYAGILGFQTGYALVFRSKVGLAAVAPVAGAIIWRIRDEEALLRSHFGARYDEYAQRTARLIPFVY
jgi:protein-S-isoprenylcysteine O-methyltransferase Ste14